jgi:pyridoxamine 5'-phosphate oxidase-like protein
MSPPNVSWAEFAAAMPDMAAAGQRLLYQHGGPGLGYLATVRGDGGPRVHPVCPHIAEGRLWVFIGAPSPKRHDLLRDGRYALHTFSSGKKDDEFYVAGTAAACADDALIREVRASLPFNSEDDDEPFVLTIERALLSIYPGPPPSWPPVYTRWRAPRER